MPAGPRLYRFFNYEQPTYLPAPVGGWNPDANPWELPLDQASQLDNFLIRPGKIVMRGGFQVSADFTGIATPLNPEAAIVLPTGILITRAGTMKCEPWNAPLIGAGSASLASGSTAGYWLANSIGFSGVPAAYTYASADAIPGPRAINFYGTMYAIAYDSVAVAVTDAGANYHMKPLNLLTISTANPPVITVLSNAPHGGFDLIGYQSRIWVLGGIDTPGALTAHEPATLFFTNPIVAGGGSASADWKDPVSNLTNKIVMDGDHSDFGVGLATVRNGLIVLRRSSVYLLKGSTTANYTLIPLSKSVGCVDARSIVETDTGVYFMSERGLMFTNGAAVVNVSGSIEFTLQQVIRYEQQTVRDGTPGWITCVRTASGQILVSLGVLQALGVAAQPLFTAMLDPSVGKAGAWTRITSSLWQNDSSQSYGNNYAGQLYASSVPGHVVSIGDTYITAIEDARNGLSINDANTFVLCDALPSSAVKPYIAIPAAWETPIPAITVSNKRVSAIAKRYYLDYRFGSVNGDFGVAWTIQPIDALGASLDTAQTVTSDVVHLGGPAGLAGVVPSHLIQRFNRDWFPEIQDCVFTATWNVAATATRPNRGIAEIYGLGLEFQRARELR